MVGNVRGISEKFERKDRQALTTFLFLFDIVDTVGGHSLLNSHEYLGILVGVT